MTLDERSPKESWETSPVGASPEGGDAGCETLRVSALLAGITQDSVFAARWKPQQHLLDVLFL